MRVVTRGVLEAMGIRDITVANDTITAWEKYQTLRPDVILTEMVYEKGSGLELVRMIRRDPASHNPFIPIIMATAYAERINVETARDAGITEFLVKPYTAKRLFNRLLAVCHDERKFVKTSTFLGPDRRRRNDGPPTGEERRTHQPKVIQAPGVKKPELAT